MNNGAVAVRTRVAGPPIAGTEATTRPTIVSDDTAQFSLELLASPRVSTSVVPSAVRTSRTRCVSPSPTSGKCSSEATSPSRSSSARTWPTSTTSPTS